MYRSTRCDVMNFSTNFIS